LIACSPFGYVGSDACVQNSPLPISGYRPRKDTSKISSSFFLRFLDLRCMARVKWTFISPSCTEPVLCHARHSGERPRGAADCWRRCGPPGPLNFSQMPLCSNFPFRFSFLIDLVGIPVTLSLVLFPLSLPPPGSFGSFFPKDALLNPFVRHLSRSLCGCYPVYCSARFATLFLNGSDVALPFLDFASHCFCSPQLPFWGA